MAADVLPNEMSSLLTIPKEQLWINLYPNALTNIRRALKTFLDQKIGKFCEKNNAILLNYSDLKFRAKHFQVFEDYPMCRFPVSVSATYYKPESGTMAVGSIMRVDRISVTCLMHGLIHVTIFLRQSVNFDTWCAVGQQIVFLIRAGEMHYKGVRLQAIVTQECVDKMRVAFPVATRKQTFSSSSADSAATTPVIPRAKKRKISEIRPESRDTDANSEDLFDESFDFGSPLLTSTQRHQKLRPTEFSENFNENETENLRSTSVKIELTSSQDEVTVLEKSKKRKRKSRSTASA